MQSSSRRSAHRQGYTLLEMLLASAIAVLLLGALYVAIDVQLRQMQASREIVEQANITRAVVQRLGNDLIPALTPASSRATPGSSAASTLTAIINALGGTTSGTSSTTGSDPSTASASGAEMGNNASTVVPFSAGVIGDALSITVFVTRVPDLTRTAGDPSQENATPSDLRRISYWLASSGNGGLARQELQWLTSNEAQNSTQPDTSNEASAIICEEVKELSFRYFDGSGWVDFWDGSLPGPDGVTPTGPPRAIEVTFVIEIPRSSEPELGPLRKTVRQVFAVPGAPGLASSSPLPGLEALLP